MNIKKILSMLIVLTMVLAVVPSLGITASAAVRDDAEVVFDTYAFCTNASWYALEFTMSGPDAGYRDYNMVDANGSYFGGFCYAGATDGFYPNDRENLSDGFSANGGTDGSTKWTSNSTRMRIAVSKTSDTEYNITYTAINSGSETQVASLNYYGNPNGIKLPSQWNDKGGSATFYFNDVVVYEASLDNVVFNRGLADGCDWFAIEFTMGGSGFGYRDVTMVDLNGNQFGGFCYAGPTDGFYPEDRESLSAGFSRIAGESQDDSTKWTSDSTRMRIAVEKESNSKYSITYTAINGEAETFVAKHVYNGNVNGIKLPDGWYLGGGGATPAYGDVKVYAVVPEALVTVTATYKVNGTQVAQETLTYDASKAENVTFPAKNLVYNGEVYHADAVTLSADQDVPMTVAPHYNSNLSTVKDKNGVEYSLGDSVVLNGTFDYGMAGWTSGAFNIDLSESNGFSIVAEKNSRTNVLKEGNGGGSGNDTALGTKWPVTAGKTYYFAYDQMRDEANNHNGGIRFLRADGSDFAEITTTDICILGDVKVANSKAAFGDNADGDYVFKTTTDWSRKEYMFVIPEGVSYLGMQMAWTSNTYIDNVELREATPTMAVTSVTVNFSGAGANTPAAKTVNNVYVGQSYTYAPAYAEKQIEADGKYYEIDYANSTLTIDELKADGNVITVVYKDMEFADVELPTVGSDMFTGAYVKVTGTKNYVTNPGFETTGGDFTIFGWRSSSTQNTFAATGADHSYKVNKEKYYFIGEEITATNGTAISGGVHGGSWSFGSRYNDGVAGLCSIYNNFAVEANKTYYVSFWVKANIADDALVSVNAVSSDAAPSGDNPIWIANDTDNQDQGLGKVTAADWTKIERVIATGNNNAIQINAYWLGQGDPAFLFDDFVIVEAEEVTRTITGLDNAPERSVISGNTPVLPKQVTAHYSIGADAPVDVEWDTDGVSFTNNGSAETTVTVIGKVDGYSGNTTATVKVLPQTFALDDFSSVLDTTGYASTSNSHSFPIAVTGNVTFEFDITWNRFTEEQVIGIGNYSFMKEHGLFLGRMPIQMGGKSSGVFNATDGNGNSPSVTLSPGTYRVLISTNVASRYFSWTVTAQDGTILVNRENDIAYRSHSDGDNATSLDTFSFLTNGGGGQNGDMTTSNFKVYAPDVAGSLIEYTINYVNIPEGTLTADGSEAPKTAQTTASTDKGYNGEKIFPNLVIPYFKGYVFKTKTVNESAKTITLTYEATNTSAYFFDNVANDTPFISLNMLGAHDAFTAGIDGSRKDAAGTKQGDSGSQAATRFPNTAVSGSKAQSQDALTLLNTGVRYFDVRLSRSSNSASYLLATAPHTNGVIYTTHGLLSNEFGPILWTIAQWAKEHPGEIIVLDFQEFYDYADSSSGDSVAASWRVLDSLLASTGVKEFVTLSNGSNVADQTYGGLTQNGTKSNIVLFGRATATNDSIGNFILRGVPSEGLFKGQLYSNYDNGVSIGTSFNANAITQQITAMNTKSSENHAIASMFRVMQAQSTNTSGGLITQAAKDHSSLYTALTNASYSEWLTYLPVVMVDDAAANGDTYITEILKILKSCNVERDVTVDLGGEGSGTSTTKAMVGTLYTGKNSLLQGGEYGYYVTSETPITAGSTVIPVPYNGSISLDVKKLDSVYTMQKNPESGSGYNNVLLDGSAPDQYFSAYNWDDGNRRTGVAIIDSVIKGDYTYTLDATQLRDYSTGGRYTDFYAISYEDYQKLDISDFNAVKAYFTEENKVASNSKNFDNNDEASKAVSIPLDAEKLKNAIGASGRVVIFGDSHGGLYRLSNDMRITPAIDLTITPSLGWQDGDFTLNFVIDGGKTANIEVTSDYADTQTYSNTPGVIVQPGYTNRIYNAAATYDGIVKGAAAAASVYSLVVDELLDAVNKGLNSDLNSRRITRANEVIAMGGMLIGDDGLTAETAKLMELSSDKTTITIKEAVASLGIGFIYKDGTLYVGGGDKTVDGAPGTVYSKLTINGDSVTLSEPIGDYAGTSEAITLSLEAVNIEFIETLISESEAADAAAELDFIPEL